MDFYRILNVRRDCSNEELRRAFRQMSLQAHPDRFQGEEKKKAEKEYQYIVKAFNTLKDPSARKKYDESLEEEHASAGTAHVLESRKKEAEQYEKAGIVCSRKGQYTQAVEFLNKAVFLAPNPNTFFLKGLAEKEIAGRKKDAIVSLTKAVELDPYQTRFRKGLIEVLLGMGLKARAQKVLEEALSLFPNDAELKTLKAKQFPSAEGSSSLKSIFKVFRGKN